MFAEDVSKGAFQVYDVEIEGFNPMVFEGAKYDTEVDLSERLSVLSDDDSLVGCTMWLDLGNGHAHLVENVNVDDVGIASHIYC